MDTCSFARNERQQSRGHQNKYCENLQISICKLTIKRRETTQSYGIAHMHAHGTHIISPRIQVKDKS